MRAFLSAEAPGHSTISPISLPQPAQVSASSWQMPWQGDGGWENKEGMAPQG
ncbi:MAG: hypothetical protein V4709_00155 [Pseudomonadota bacterium]